MSTFVMIALYLAFSTFGLVCVKLGSNATLISIKTGVLSLSLSLYTVAGLVLYTCSFLLWMIILQKFKLNYISPVISGISYVCILVASFLILHESITKFQLIGAIIILVGIIFMNIK